jgi:hypothetical protein
MQIKLTRTGGIIPMKKAAETEVSWTEEELQQLSENIARENKTPANARDATGYHLTYNDTTVPIDLDKVPDDYKHVFDKLKDNLQPVKTN